MASIIKVDNVQNTAAGKNIIKEVGNTVTIGASGDTVALAAGASQSGFGQTYSAVSWDTTPKTTTITGAAGVGYFVNTSGGVVTANLPAGTAGDVIAFADYAATWQTNAVTVSPNGAEKIGGTAGSVTLNTEGQSVTLVYVDSTQGWINTMDSTSNVRSNAYMAATVSGACNTLATAPCCANVKIATFTGPGSFTVTNAAVCAADNLVSYMVVAGGAGGGGDDIGAGGGAGGFRFAAPSLAPLCYPAKPLAGPADIPVSVQGYPIAVGGGGTKGSPSCRKGGTGVNSSFSTITSTGGGGGGGGNNDPGPSPNHTGGNGGSGGGGGFHPACRGQGGSGNTPLTTPAQGTDGGDNPGSSVTAGGGGGATTIGPSGPGSGSTGTPGGAGGGLPTFFGSNGVPCGSYIYYAGGGGGSGDNAPFGTGGLGGGGVGGPSGVPTPGIGGSGIANSGGGGGGAGGNGATSGCGGTGGSGIVVIRYKFQ